MSADPTQIMRILDLRGIDLRLVGGQLQAHWPHGDHVPADMAAFIRHVKPLIVAELQERERLAETVTNAMLLDDAAYRQWIAEIRSAPRDDPNLAHDRHALERVRRLKERARWAAEKQEAA